MKPPQELPEVAPTSTAALSIRHVWPKSTVQPKKRTLDSAELKHPLTKCVGKFNSSSACITAVVLPVCLGPTTICINLRGSASLWVSWDTNLLLNISNLPPCQSYYTGLQITQYDLLFTHYAGYAFLCQVVHRKQKRRFVDTPHGYSWGECQATCL